MKLIISKPVLFKLASYTLCLVVLVLFFQSTLLTLHEKWAKFDEHYSHGYFIVLLALYWIAAAISEPRTRFDASAWAIPFAILAGITWYFGYATQVALITQFALPVILYTLLLAIFGWNLVLRLIFPFVFLYLALPFWDVLQPALRYATMKVAQQPLHLLNIPAYIDGYVIQLPYGLVEVAGGCSGLNYFMIGVVIGLYNAQQNAASRFEYALSVLLAVLLSIVANWVRVILLVFIGYYSQMKSDLMRDHVVFGWVVFAVFLVIYFISFRKLQSYLHKQRKQSESALIESDNSTLPMEEEQLFVASKLKQILVVSLSFVFILILPARASFEQNQEGQATSKGSDWSLSEWSPIEESTLKLGYLHWDEERHWRKAMSSSVLELSILGYYQQSQGKEMIYYKNRVAPEELIVDSGTYGRDTIIKWEHVKVDFFGYLVFHLYKIGKEYTHSDFKGKWLQFTEGLVGNNHSEFIALTVRCGNPNCEKEKTEQSLSAYTDMLGAVLETNQR